MLSQKTRYALRALLHLAEHAEAEGAPVPLARIAERQRAPRKFLEAIMVELGRAGFVASRRGPGGGFTLKRTADSITFAEVIRAVDGPIALVPCASLNFYARCGDCHDESGCAIRRAMVVVRDETDRILSQTTLASALKAEESVETLEDRTTLTRSS